MPESGTPQYPAWAAGSPTQVARLRKSASYTQLRPKDTLVGIDGFPVTPSTASPVSPQQLLFPGDSERGSPGETVPPDDMICPGGNVRLFGPLPNSMLWTVPMSTKAEAEDPGPQSRDATRNPRDEPQNQPMWMQVKAFEQRTEQLLAHEQMGRQKAQTAANELAQQLEESKQVCAVQNRTLEQLTARLQEQEWMSAKGIEAQAALHAKEKDISSTLALTQQRLNDSEEARKKLTAQLEQSEQSRQADVASHAKEKDSIQKASQAQLDKQASHHDAATKAAQKQHSDLQIQLAQTKAEHSESQKKVAELRAELEQMEADYKKAMAGIAQALSQPLMGKVSKT